MSAPAWVFDHVQPGEQPLWWGRPSLLGLVPIALSALAGAAYIAAQTAYRFPTGPEILPGPFAVLVAVAGLATETARRFVRLRFTAYVLTRDRFVSVTTFIATDARSVPLERVTRLWIRRGLFGGLLGIWNATLGVHGDERGHLAVPAIRDGEGLAAALADGQARAARASWILRGD